MATFLKKDGEEKYAQIVEIAPTKYVVAELLEKPTIQLLAPKLNTTAKLLTTVDDFTASFISIANATAGVTPGWSVYAVNTTPICTNIALVSVVANSRTEVYFEFSGQNISNATWEIRNSSNQVVNSGSINPVVTYGITRTLANALTDGAHTFIWTGVSCIGTVSRTFDVNFDVTSVPTPVLSSYVADTDDVITITAGQNGDIEIFDGASLIDTIVGFVASASYVFATPGTYRVRLKNGANYSAFSSEIAVTPISVSSSTFFAEPHTDGQREYFGNSPTSYNLAASHAMVGGNLNINLANPAADVYYFDLIRPNKHFSGNNSHDLSEFAGYPISLYVIQGSNKQTVNYYGHGDIFRANPASEPWGYWVSCVYLPRTSTSDIPAFMDTSDNPTSLKFFFTDRFPNFTPPAGIAVIVEAMQEDGDSGTVKLHNFNKGITHMRYPYSTNPLRSYIFSHDSWLNRHGGGGLGNPWPNFSWMLQTLDDVNQDVVQILSNSWNEEAPIDTQIAMLDGESFPISHIMSHARSSDLIDIFSAVFAHMRTKHSQLGWWTYNPYGLDDRLRVTKQTTENAGSIATIQADELAEYKSHYNFNSLADLMAAGKGAYFWTDSNLYNKIGQHLNLWCIGRYLNRNWDYFSYFYVQQLEVLNKIKTTEKLIGFPWHMVELLNESDSAPAYLHYDFATRHGNQIAFWERLKPNAPPSYNFAVSYWSVLYRASIFNWDTARLRTNDKGYNYQETTKQIPVGGNPYLNINPKVNNDEPPLFFYGESNSHRTIDWGMYAVYLLSQPNEKSILETNAPVLFTEFTLNGTRYNGDNLYPAHAQHYKLPIVRTVKHPTQNMWIISAQNECAGGIDIDTITVHIPNTAIDVVLKIKGQWLTHKLHIA